MGFGVPSLFRQMDLALVDSRWVLWQFRDFARAPTNFFNNLINTKQKHNQMHTHLRRWLDSHNSSQCPAISNQWRWLRYTVGHISRCTQLLNQKISSACFNIEKIYSVNFAFEIMSAKLLQCKNCVSLLTQLSSFCVSCRCHSTPPITPQT